MDPDGRTMRVFEPRYAIIRKHQKFIRDAKFNARNDKHNRLLFASSLLEGVNLLVSSGTASAIAGDRLAMVRRKTARQDDTKVS